MNKIAILWITVTIIGILIASFFIGTVIIKDITWEQKTKTGTLNEIILYNTFPDNELLITFEDGTFLLITKNHFGSYAVLSQIPIGTEIEIKYKENGNHEIYVKSIEVIENE